MRNLLKNINLFIFKCLIVFCVLFNITGTHAQIYPVQISNQLIPPYSGYLPDYADPSSEKLRLILQFNDFTKPNYDVKLKLEIKGNGFSLVTKQLYNPPPISLQPGVPFILTGTDLAPYLNSNNLDFIGINQSQYEQRMALPEGYYSICVTAYDYSNPAKIQVSNTACSNAWFTLSNPPLLNLPGCNSILTPQTPQNILFQWTPVNIGSPNSANSTEYEFALWEIKPDSSANPNQVVLSTAPIYSTTTNLTIVNYGITEPPLNLYTKYAWRVRAVDLSGRDWFKNNGYSQVCSFTYGNVGNVLGNSLSLNLTAQGITHRMGLCSWNNQSAFTNYKLQVRKQGTTNWFDYNTTTNSEKINNLEANTDYEARVRGESNSYTSDWSNTATFRTLSEPVYGCGDQSQLNDPLPANPLPVTKAIPGLIVQSGQFEVKVTQISPNGGQGWYKGKGIAKVMGLPVAVQFTNIYIDDNNRHQQGVIQAMTKGIDNWLHQWDIKDAEENASYFNGTIDSVHVNANGQICVYFQGTGRDSCFDAPNQNVVVVRDENGNQYTVQLIPPPPKVIGPTNYFQVSNDVLEASDSLKVVFEASPNQKFGFDAKKYTAWTNNYELIKLAGGKTYFVPYKSVGENQNDEVYANVTAFNFDAQKLSFKTVGGQTCTAVNVQGKLYKLTVPHTANAVYAWYNGKKIGKLSVISLPAITRKLVIVPVNNATINNQALNNQALNTIFQQANVSWSVSIKSSFNYSLSPNGLQAADAGLMSKYSPEMRALRDAYRNADSTYDKQAYYVFVVNNFSDPNIKGYMVRGRALGFVAASATVKDIAHELAHGAFGLEHTFPTIQKSSSDNLLDYKQGTELSKVQWEEMQKSGPIFNWFDDEEDAAMAAEDLIKWLKRFFDVNCINNYKNYDGVIPECAWNNMLLDAMPDKGKGCAMVCGLLDGAFITIKDAINITALVDCWSPLNPNSSSQYCEDVKSKTIESIKTIREICGSSEGYRKIYNAIIKELDDWSVATFCTDRTCAYNQGKLLFDLLSVFYGGTEVKAALKSGVAGARIAQMMEEVDKTFKIISKTFTSLGKSITKTAAGIQLCVKLNGNPNFVLATLDASKKAIKFNNVELPASVQGDVIGKLDGINYIEGGIVKRGDIEIIEYEGSNGNKVAGWRMINSIINKKLITKPSWLPNRIIIGNHSNPVGIIGVYSKSLPNGSVIQDTKNVLEELNFDVATTQNFKSISKDGFKLLNTPSSFYKNPTQFWEEFNKPWLDNLKLNKSNVIVLSDRSNELLKYVLNPNGTFLLENGQRVLTGFGKEIQYMDNLVNQGLYMWDGINGVYKYIGN